MAFILGVVNTEEQNRVRNSGYECLHVNSEAEMALFKGLRENDPDDSNADDEKMYMVFVDCEITDLLVMKDDTQPTALEIIETISDENGLLLSPHSMLDFMSDYITRQGQQSAFKKYVLNRSNLELEMGEEDE